MSEAGYPGDSVDWYVSEVCVLLCIISEGGINGVFYGMSEPDVPKTCMHCSVVYMPEAGSPGRIS